MSNNSDDWEVVHSNHSFVGSLLGAYSFQGPATDHTVKNKQTGEVKRVRTHGTHADLLDNQKIGEKIARGDFL